LPNTLAGLKNGTSMAVVGELVAADHGLGYYLIYANGQVDTVGAFVSLLS
jgi:ABC-type nitrate/sulfonate/bicarbonate transport system permease component